MVDDSSSALPLPPPIPKELLEEILECQVLTYSVENGSKPGDGYMSVLYSVTAEVLKHTEDNQPVKDIRHLLFKCFPSHPARQGYLRKTNMFYNELAFYQVWVKSLLNFQTDTLGISKDKIVVPAFPPFVGGKAIDFTESKEESEIPLKPLDNFIVMTDLRKCGDFRMVSKAGGLDFQHLSLVLTELAKVHALGWAYKCKVDWDVTRKFSFLTPRLDSEDLVLWCSILNSNVDKAIQTMDSALGESNVLSHATKNFAKNLMPFIEFFLDSDKEKEIWEYHRSPPSEYIEAGAIEEPWRIQCHGDLWANNILFAYNEEGVPQQTIMFDFQLTREACPSVDLSYLIYTATTAQFRKQYLDTLFQQYCTEFEHFCERLGVPLLPGFSLDSLKRKFHRSKVIGYMMAMIVFPNMLMESDRETNLEQVETERSMEEMFTEAFGKGVTSTLYRERILEIAQDLYEDGVI